MGQLLKLDVPKGHYALERYRQLDYGDDDTPTTAPVLEAHARTIRSALERTFSMLKEKLAGRTVYVTLSGGLDSTTIAAMARKTFDDLHAVSFAIEGEDAGGPGTDLHFARRAAADLGIPLVEIVAAADEVAALVDDVLVYGQDFRDFNVHCALVNAAIGRALGVRHADDGSRPVVLTGDTMNELLADYTPVQLEGREYYGLPNLGPGRIRRFLVGGLDAGDREVGVFDHFGVDTVQPYALCAAEYAALPGSLVAEDGAKSRLVQAVMGTDVPPYIYDRPKVRAQVASQDKPSGTLALLVGRGIDQARLTERFAELMGVPADEVPRLIRAGFYRFSTIFPAYAC
jgi:asparagine synthetase B (glutamine-hydrolysing)